MTSDTTAVSRGNIRLLQVTVFTSAIDRATAAPLIVLIALDLQRSVDAAGLVATSYLLGYGLMQLFWAVASDRFGRVRIIRVALLIAAASGLVSAVAPNLELLVASRAVSGCAFAAVIPASLVYVGDVVGMRLRHGVLAAVATGSAVGFSVGTLGGAVVGELFNWRAAFGGTAVLAAVLAVLVGRLPEPPSAPRHRLATALPMLARDRGALLVLALAGLEGFALFGFLVFIPATLQLSGTATSVSGIVVAVYGVAVVASAVVVKRASLRWSAAALIASGGCAAISAYAVLGAFGGLAAASIGCALLGVAWTLMHTSLQAWATEAVPSARAFVVSGFATMLFIGSAAGALVGGALVARGDADLMFLIGLVAAVPLTIAASVGRSRQDL